MNDQLARVRARLDDQLARVRARLDEWEALHQAGAAVPWDQVDGGIGSGDVWVAYSAESQHATAWHNRQARADATLVVAARNALPGYIALCRDVLDRHVDERFGSLPGAIRCRCCGFYTYPCPDVRAVIRAVLDEDTE